MLGGSIRGLECRAMCANSSYGGTCFTSQPTSLHGSHTTVSPTSFCTQPQWRGTKSRTLRSLQIRTFRVPSAIGLIHTTLLALPLESSWAPSDPLNQSSKRRFANQFGSSLERYTRKMAEMARQWTAHCSASLWAPSISNWSISSSLLCLRTLSARLRAARTTRCTKIMTTRTWTPLSLTRSRLKTTSSGTSRRFS